MKGAVDLASLLSQTLGQTKARQEIMRVVDEKGYSPASLSQEEALDVLERLTEQEGIVGISARFAKGRVHLVWKASSAAPQRR
jgi:hypothetical protein